MSAAPELKDIVEFLRAHHPFDRIPPNALQQAASTLEIGYQRKNRVVLSVGAKPEFLYVVRQGAVDLVDVQGGLVERAGEGDLFGYVELVTNAPAHYTATTIEDTLLYHLPASVFQQLCSQYPAFNEFFLVEIQQQATITRSDVALTTPIAQLVKRQALTISPESTIHAAAEYMKQERVSSLLVVQDQQLVGILTDRDLRNRVVAERRDYDTPIAAVMTRDPLTIDAKQHPFEAHLLMSRHNIHHLPVMDGSTLIGLITTTDLMRMQASSPVHLIGEITKQNSVEAIAEITASRLQQLFLQIVKADATAYDIGHVVTMVTDAVTRRLLELAEAELGQPPIPYAWVVFGSQARQEQGIRTDQDNGLLLAEAIGDQTYFEKLAKRVNDGLASCGYDYCPGGVMAINWTQTYAEWRSAFMKWMKEPDPEALLKSSIFFDMRAVYGDESLVKKLQHEILEVSQDNSVFLGCLAKNALSFHPPLSFFRRFVLEKGGEHHHTLDLKHRGVAPITDLARVYSLAHGITEVNTADRLTALIPTPALVAADAANLRDTLEYISYVRLQHQAEQILRGAQPDNYVNPDQLSGFERQHLKAAFHIVRQMQNAHSQHYLTSLIS